MHDNDIKLCNNINFMCELDFESQINLCKYCGRFSNYTLNIKNEKNLIKTYIWYIIMFCIFLYIP